MDTKRISRKDKKAKEWQKVIQAFQEANAANTEKVQTKKIEKEVKEETEEIEEMTEKIEKIEKYIKQQMTNIKQQMQKKVEDMKKKIQTKKKESKQQMKEELKQMTEEIEKMKDATYAEQIVSKKSQNANQRHKEFEQQRTEAIKQKIPNCDTSVVDINGQNLYNIQQFQFITCRDDYNINKPLLDRQCQNFIRLKQQLEQSKQKLTHLKAEIRRYTKEQNMDMSKYQPVWNAKQIEVKQEEKNDRLPAQHPTGNTDNQQVTFTPQENLRKQWKRNNPQSNTTILKGGNPFQKQ